MESAMAGMPNPAPTAKVSEKAISATAPMSMNAA